MKQIFIFLAAMVLCAAAYAGDDMAATRLHSMGKDYDLINGGNSDFPRPLGAIAVKFETPIEEIGAYKNGHAYLAKMSVPEVRRIEALRRKLITMYVRTYSGCNIDQNSRWELIIACDPAAGLTDGKEQIKDMPSEDGIDLTSRRLTYPVVRGWYCLVDKKTKTVVLDKEVSGNGAVIDTALDDFSRKLVMDFADNIKEK
jgi:hypothetical protein